ncbi:hypothetical protein BST61_g6611 [Cercospora zeina]
MATQDNHDRVSMRLTPVEKVYKAELAALNRIAESGLYRNYTHGTTPEGSRIWTLKRKRSLTEHNLRRLNQHHRNKVPRLSHSGVDYISPTGNTEWRDTTLSDLLDPPDQSTLAHCHRDALMHKAYLRARAGVIPSRYAPWDYVSNGAPAQFYDSAEEKKWWETHNEAYHPSVGGTHGEIRKGFTQEWCYDVKLMVWYRQVKILEEWKFRPAECKERWVVRNTETKQEEIVSPRGVNVQEKVVDRVRNVEALRNNSPHGQEKFGMGDTRYPAMQPVADETGLSFVRWEDPVNAQASQETTRRISPLPQAIVDETGLSFIGWRQKTNKKKRSRLPRSPLEQLRHGSIRKTPSTKRRLSKSLWNSRENENVDALVSRSGTEFSAREKKVPLKDAVVVDEAGLSVVGWRNDYTAKERKKEDRGK